MNKRLRDEADARNAEHGRRALLYVRDEQPLAQLPRGVDVLGDRRNAHDRDPGLEFAHLVERVDAPAAPDCARASAAMCRLFSNEPERRIVPSRPAPQPKLERRRFRAGQNGRERSLRFSLYAANIASAHGSMKHTAEKSSTSRSFPSGSRQCQSQAEGSLGCRKGCRPSSCSGFANAAACRTARGEPSVTVVSAAINSARPSPLSPRYAPRPPARPALALDEAP